MPGSLEANQPWVLVTGASAGIGTELARCFARDGSNLILVARRQERLRQLAEELRAKFDVEVRSIPADLSQADGCRTLYHELQQDGVEVDVLVNNAGFGLNGIFHELELEKELDLIRLNIEALAHLSRLFLPKMIERNRGGILNVGSTAAFQAGPRMALYYASKAFVLSLSEAIHEEVAGTKVHVSCLCPGPTKTEFGQVADMEDKPMLNIAPMTAQQVAEIGYRGFCKNKPIVVAGIGNRMLAQVSRLSPRWLTRKLAKRLQ